MSRKNVVKQGLTQQVGYIFDVTCHLFIFKWRWKNVTSALKGIKFRNICVDSGMFHWTNVHQWNNQTRICHTHAKTNIQRCASKHGNKNSERKDKQRQKRRHTAFLYTALGVKAKKKWIWVSDDAQLCERMWMILNRFCCLLSFLLNCDALISNLICMRNEHQRIFFSVALTTTQLTG